MNVLDIHPYYYPTTVVVVDDNTDFLVNFSLQLDERFALRLYSSPAAALKDTNKTFSSIYFTQKSFFTSAECLNQKKPQHLIELNIAALSQELENPNRFSEKSVIIVDYDMPSINGISFCSAIQNKNIKKILISGIADEKVAIKAFNEGVIDRFILKSDDDSIKQINDFILESQDQYFGEKTAALKNALNVGLYTFLQEPAFIALFHEICSQRRIIEYYLTTDPCGFVLHGETGELTHLLILSEDEIIAHLDIIHDQGGPAGLYEQIERRKTIPFFVSVDGYYTPDIVDWQACIHPAKKLRKSSPYYYSVIDNPPHYKELSGKIYQYNKYLETLDHSVKEHN